jgi:hypothetical protein
MAGPYRPRQCPSPGCDLGWDGGPYWTGDHSTYQEVFNDLDDHQGNHKGNNDAIWELLIDITMAMETEKNRRRRRQERKERQKIPEPEPELEPEPKPEPEPEPVPEPETAAEIATETATNDDKTNAEIAKETAKKAESNTVTRSDPEADSRSMLGTPGALGGGPDQPPGGPGGTSKDRRTKSANPEHNCSVLGCGAHVPRCNSTSEGRRQEGKTASQDRTGAQIRHDRSTTVPKIEQTPSSKPGEQPQTPSLQETDSRTSTGTPGALGGGPDQPPGGPGGTSNDHRKRRKKKKKKRKKKSSSYRAPEPGHEPEPEGRRPEDSRLQELNSIHDTGTGARARPRQRRQHAGRGTRPRRGRIKPCWGCDTRNQGPSGPLGVVLTSPPAVLGGPVKTGRRLPVLGEIEDSDVSDVDDSHDVIISARAGAGPGAGLRQLDPADKRTAQQHRLQTDSRSCRRRRS